MIYHHSEEEIKEYFLSEKLNQSSIKVILSSGMESYLSNKEDLKSQEEVYYEEKPHFVIGTGVDMWITYGEDFFNRRHHITTLTKKPSDAIMSITNQLFDNIYKVYLQNVEHLPEEERPLFTPSLDDIDLRTQINDIAVQYGYQPSYGTEARVSAVVRAGIAYWDELCKAVNKQILSSEEYATIKSIVESFYNSPFLSRLIFDHYKEGTSSDVIMQTPLYFTVENTECKALLDIVIVDHERKIIIPLDIKTHGGYLSTFKWSIKKNRYDIQASFYTDAMNRVGKDYLADLLKKPEVASYEVAPFAFLVQSTKKVSVPLIFVLNEKCISNAYYGIKTESGFTPGIMQGVRKYSAWAEVGFNFDEVLLNSQASIVSHQIIFVDENYDYPQHNCL